MGGLNSHTEPWHLSVSSKKQQVETRHFLACPKEDYDSIRLFSLPGGGPCSSHLALLSHKQKTHCRETTVGFCLEAADTLDIPETRAQRRRQRKTCGARIAHRRYAKKHIKKTFSTVGTELLQGLFKPYFREMCHNKFAHWIIRTIF